MNPPCISVISIWSCDVSPSHTVSLHHCPWSEQLLQCTERAPVTAHTQTWQITNELQWKQSRDQGKGRADMEPCPCKFTSYFNIILPCNSLLIFTFWYIINMHVIAKLTDSLFSGCSGSTIWSGNRGFNC